MRYIPKIDCDIPDYEQLIDNWIFSERDREIMKLKLINAWTYEQVAEKVDLSVSQTKRVVKRCRAELAKHL